MQRLIAFPVILLISIALGAQAPERGANVQGAKSFGTVGTMNAGSATAPVYVYPSSSAECPVSMHAEQRGGVGVLVTRDGQRHPASRRIRLTLARPYNDPAHQHNAPQIVSAKVTVSGANGKARMAPVATLEATPQKSRQDDSAEATKTLDLTFQKTENGSVAADMDLPGFATVSSIRIDSLAYSDGSTWTAFRRNVCLTAPDPFMLVNSR